MPFTRSRIPLIGLTVGVLLLAGCASTPEAAPSTPAATSAAPSPSASALPDDAASVLFTVAAKARAADGTTLDLLLTGHTPVAASDADTLRDDFLVECQDAGGMSLSETGTAVSEESLTRFGSALMRIDFEVSPEGHTLSAPVDVIAGIDNFPIVAVGDGVQLVQSTDTCLNRYALTGSGSGTFIADYETGDVNPDVDQWRFGSYGFTVTSDSGATLESCDVAISDLAREGLSEVPGWPDGSVGTGISCGTGFIGE